MSTKRNSREHPVEGVLVFRFTGAINGLDDLLKRAKIVGEGDRYGTTSDFVRAASQMPTLIGVGAYEEDEDGNRRTLRFIRGKAGLRRFLVGTA